MLRSIWVSDIAREGFTQEPKKEKKEILIIIVVYSSQKTTFAVFTLLGRRSAEIISARNVKKNLRRLVDNGIFKSAGY